MSDFIGAIVGATTGTVYAVINPTFDSELDNPRLLLLRGEADESMRMVKLPRGEHAGALSLNDVSEIVAGLST